MKKMIEEYKKHEKDFWIALAWFIGFLGLTLLGMYLLRHVPLVW